MRLRNILKLNVILLDSKTKTKIVSPITYCTLYIYVRKIGFVAVFHERPQQILYFVAQISYRPQLIFAVFYH